MDKALKYIEQHNDAFISELFELLRIPSISAQSEHKPDMQRCAEWLAASLVKAGADHAEVMPTAGNPVVFAEKTIDPAAKTVLVYGHYDVMPVDPREEWHTEPFEPVVKDGRIWGRGADDDKGQLFMHAKAFGAMCATDTLPCNVKFMLEGEEEIGSEHLYDFCRENKEMLKADIILVSDTSMISLDTPSITCGLRGLTYMEVEVTGPNKDLHSGLFGGAVANPANVLTRLVASLIDENGHVTIPGFYDDVRELTVEEREAFNKAPFSLDEYKRALDIDEVEGEKGYTTIERTGVRPSLDVNGIWGGLYGRRHQDGDSVEGFGQNIDAPRAQSGFQQDRRIVRRTFQEDRAQKRQGRCQVPARRCTVRCTDGHGGIQGCREGHRNHIRKETSALLLGRVDSHHQRVRADTRDQVAFDRIRTFGGRHSLAQ